MHRMIMMFIVAGAVAVPAVSAAQRPEVIQHGATIRVLMKGKQLQVGRLDSLTSITLAMSRDSANDGATSLNIGRNEVVRLEVRGKSRVRGALKGAGLGFLAGSISGIVLGAAMHEESANCWIVCSRAESAMLVGALGALIVTPIGLVGGAARGSDTWRRVDPRSARMP